jgi:hypothetical protein
MPNFEKFRRYKLTADPVPIVAFHARGLFALNELAYEAIDRPEAIELFYDPSEMVIGFKGATRDSPDAYVVRHHTKHSYQVEGRGLVRYYKIPEEATGKRYRAEMVGDILAVDLKQQLEDEAAKG